MAAVNFILRQSVLLFCCLALLNACSRKQYKEPHVVIHTTMGDIELELYPSKAPQSVAAFLKYVDDGLYKNTSFYRVLKLEDMPADYNPGIIQGGLYSTNDQKKAALKGTPHESTQQTGLSHTSGAVSLARTTPGTASTEFFICIDDQSQFDYGNDTNGDKEGFAVFGKVVEGMNVVKKIQAQKRNGENFVEKIVISDIERL